MILNIGVGWTGDQEKIEGFQNNERIKDNLLYTQQIIFHRAKPERKIIYRPKKNILTEDVIKEGLIEAQILHLKYRYPIKTKGMVTEGVIQEGVVQD
jgi:hypothetical protein